MKKIMFNDKYDLTKAVLEGRKTMTRRIVSQSALDYYLYEAEDPTIIDAAKYDIGDVVAVAQAYKDIYPNADFEMVGKEFMTESAGWNNKMFVRADLMPHRIKMTGIKVERLQDISDEDCRKEGIDYVGGYSESYYFGHGVENIRLGNSYREAFAALIDKVSGKGTWESNPWVFVYEFELVEE